MRFTICRKSSCNKESVLIARQLISLFFTGLNQGDTFWKNEPKRIFLRSFLRQCFQEGKCYFSFSISVFLQPSLKIFIPSTFLRKKYHLSSENISFSRRILEESWNNARRMLCATSHYQSKAVKSGQVFHWLGRGGFSVLSSL